MKISLTNLIDKIAYNPQEVLSKLAILTCCIGIGCQNPSIDSNNSNPNKKNLAPDTEIKYNFTGNGKVEYEFIGTDEDGYIDKIIFEINNKDKLEAENYEKVLFSIEEGINTVKATARDNEGLLDPTPAIYSFYSPTEKEAKKIIGGILDEKKAYYDYFKENALICLEELNEFYVDYFIRKNDGTYAVINYIGYEKDLEEENSNKELLESYGIPTMKIIRLPEKEIKLKLNNFISKNEK